MGKQPGVMLYFDVRDSIRALTQAEKGDLFDAILDYGQSQLEPDFGNDRLALIWPFVRKDIHKDAQRYEARRQAGILGAQRRWGTAAEESKPMAGDGKPMANIPSASASSETASPAAAAAPTTPAAAAETDSAAGNSAPAPLRENGTHLPDCVAKYVPKKSVPLSPEEFAMRKQEWLSILRARPDDA